MVTLSNIIWRLYKKSKTRGLQDQTGSGPAELPWSHRDPRRGPRAGEGRDPVSSWLLEPDGTKRTAPCLGEFSGIQSLGMLAGYFPPWADPHLLRGKRAD